MKKDIKNFIVLPEVDSTNNYANHLISKHPVENGTVVLAYFQNKGRGQRENHWISQSGKNMLASIILYPTFLPVPMQFYLSKVISLALVKWLNMHNIEASVKWPNDIYAGSKKIAGILIETSVMGSTLHSAVAGIGFNLNQTEFSHQLPNPLSVKQLTGVHYGITETASEIRDITMNLYKKLESGACEEIDSAYLNHLFRYNEWAMYRENGRLFEARITGIGEYGHLVVEERSGNTSSYAFKEIEFVL